MVLLRYMLGGVLLLFGLLIIVTNYARQVSNFRNRNKDGGWSSPAPILGPMFVIVGYATLPVEFSNWVLLAAVLDPDTIILLGSLPHLIRALRD